MSDLDMLGIVVGFFSPLLIAVVSQPHWPSSLKVALVAAVSVAGGVATAAITGQLHLPLAWLHATLIVLVAAIGFYHTAWRKTASRLEAATSPAPNPPPGSVL